MGDKHLTPLVVIFIMLATASSANNVPSRTADDARWCHSMRPSPWRRCGGAVRHGRPPRHRRDVCSMAWRRAHLSLSADPSVLLSPGMRSVSLRQKLTLLGDVCGQGELVSGHREVERTTVPLKSTRLFADRALVPVAPNQGLAGDCRHSRDAGRSTRTDELVRATMKA